MESIPDEIKLMEQIANHLKMWFQEHPDDKDYPSGIVNLRFRNGISLKLWLEAHFDEVLTYLRVNDHKDIARSLEQERDSFLSELQAVEQAIERGDNPPLELIELRSKITYLIGTLEHTAKAFTEKAEQESKAVKEPPKKRGRPKKHTVSQLKEVRASYDKYYKEIKDKKGAWNKAAKEHKIESGKAAEMACRRYLKQNK